MHIQAPLRFRCLPAERRKTLQSAQKLSRKVVSNLTALKCRRMACEPLRERFPGGRGVGAGCSPAAGSVLAWAGGVSAEQPTSALQTRCFPSAGGVGSELVCASSCSLKGEKISNPLGPASISQGKASPSGSSGHRFFPPVCRVRCKPGF